MILVMSITITLLAAVQWIFIRRQRRRLVRVLLQVPLLVVTFFGSWWFAVLMNNDSNVVSEAQVEIIDRTQVIQDDLLVTVSATGAILPDRQVALVFALAGVPVREIYVQAGDRILAGQLLAALDISDTERAVENARIALELQQVRFDALTSAPREVDLAVAEAQLVSARSQLNAAFATGTSSADREISRLQTEIARNQLWQAQLSRDALSAPTALTVDLSGLNNATDGIPNPPADAIQDGLNNLAGSLNSTIESLNAQQQQQFQAQLSQTQSLVSQAEMGVQIADVRYGGTLNQGADPGSVAAANAALVQAEITLERLQNGASASELELASIQLEQAQLAYDLAAASQAQGTLSAPFDGLVAQSNLKVGELPPQGAAIVLVDDSQFYVDLPVDESEIARVRIGQRVIVEVDALPGVEVRGEVVSIAYAPIRIGQLVAFNTRVRIDAADVAIRTGMTVTGNVVVIERQDVLLVRNSFIRRDQQSGEARVWVLDASGIAQERTIILGDRNDTFSEVLTGLEAGEEIVLVPVEESIFGN
jgi:HlyD family secretion protein